MIRGKIPLTKDQASVVIKEYNLKQDIGEHQHIDHYIGEVKGRRCQVWYQAKKGTGIHFYQGIDQQSFQDLEQQIKEIQQRQVPTPTYPTLDDKEAPKVPGCLTDYYQKSGQARTT